MSNTNTRANNKYPVQVNDFIKRLQDHNYDDIEVIEQTILDLLKSKNMTPENLDDPAKYYSALESAYAAEALKVLKKVISRNQTDLTDFFSLFRKYFEKSKKGLALLGLKDESEYKSLKRVYYTFLADLILTHIKKHTAEIKPKQGKASTVPQRAKRMPLEFHFNLKELAEEYARSVRLSKQPESVFQVQLTGEKSIEKFVANKYRIMIGYYFILIYNNYFVWDNYNNYRKLLAESGLSLDDLGYNQNHAIKHAVKPMTQYLNTTYFKLRESPECCEDIKTDIQRLKLGVKKWGSRLKYSVNDLSDVAVHEIYLSRAKFFYRNLESGNMRSDYDELVKTVELGQLSYKNDLKTSPTQLQMLVKKNNANFEIDWHYKLAKLKTGCLCSLFFIIYSILFFISFSKKP